VKIVKETMDENFLQSPLPFINRLRLWIYGSNSPKLFVKIIYSLNTSVSSLFVFWHVLGFAAVFLRKFVFSKKQIAVDEIIQSNAKNLGYTFEENAEIKDLQPFEGDTIIQARFGQSIRFGSTVSVLSNDNTWSKNNEDTNGDPITIITNRQGNRVVRNKFDSIVEDINKDGSSIYMTSTQEIDIKDLYNFPLNSFRTSIKDPGISNAVKLSTKPTSNQFTSAADQDKKSNG
jgi:hypothetical protein